MTYPNAQITEFVRERFVAAKFNLKERHPDFKDVVGRGKPLWSPLFIYMDCRGNEFRRNVGYLSPDEFLAELHLTLGLGALLRNAIDESLSWLDGIAAAKPDTLAAPEALYWAAAAAYRVGGIPAVVARWDALCARYPDGPWTRRVRDVAPAEARST